MKHIIEYTIKRCEKCGNVRMCEGFGNEFCQVKYEPCGGEHDRYLNPDVNLCKHYIVSTMAATIEDGVTIIRKKVWEDEKGYRIKSVGNTPVSIGDVDSDRYEISIHNVDTKPSSVYADVPQLNGRF